MCRWQLCRPPHHGRPQVVTGRRLRIRERGGAAGFVGLPVFDGGRGGYDDTALRRQGRLLGRRRRPQVY